jgi:hypothetical protein
VDRWIEGTRLKPLDFSHIYVVVGFPPFHPQRWVFAEPTLKGIPLGWDVVGHVKKNGNTPLPELAGIGNVLQGAKEVVAEKLHYKPEDLDLSPQTLLSDIHAALTPRRIVVALAVGAILGGVVSAAKGNKKA